MTNLYIRQAEAADISVISDFVQCLLDELSGSKAPGDSKTLEPIARDLLRSGDVVGLLAFWGGAPIGVMMLNPCAAIYAGGRFGEITELFVLPEWRSKGVAAELLKAAIALGVERGWKRLEVGAPNQPEWSRTFKFYCDNGFDEVGPRLRRVM